MIARGVFARRDVAHAGVNVLTLEDATIRRLATHLPRFVTGQPVPALRIPRLSAEIAGSWSLWRIAAVGAESQRARIMPLFVHDDGRVLMPTARHLWDQLVNELAIETEPAPQHPVEKVLPEIHRAAEAHGRSIYDALVQEHRMRMDRERSKATAAFESRHRAIERIGLPAVRAHRLAELEREERAWQETIERRTHVQPELTPIVIVRISPSTP